MVLKIYLKIYFEVYISVVGISGPRSISITYYSFIIAKKSILTVHLLSFRNF